jgi:YbgC/YbaW family acyl-CoA thioester hydrolase
MINIVERRIMWGDLDAAGIVFYPRYSEWIDGCAHQFFEAIGIPHDRLWRDHHMVFGLVETQCRFKNAGRYHEYIVIATQLRELDARGLTLQHVITRKNDETVLVTGIEKRICLDTSDPLKLKAAAIPESIFQILDCIL